jgi:hypothetical protein
MDRSVLMVNAGRLAPPLCMFSLRFRSLEGPTLRDVKRNQLKTKWASARDLVGDVPPTEDDVPITPAGERLDTLEKVRRFIDDLNAARRD